MPSPDALTVLDAVDPTTTHSDVENLLHRAGWTPCGAGDWAFALAAPEAEAVARISPFDPVGPYTARLYAEAASTGRMPELLLHRRLAGGGDLQVMERLHPVPTTEAVDFLTRFTHAEPELVALVEIVSRVHGDALRDLPWCGPLDTNPSNVMRTGTSRLVLSDPYYADGPRLYETAYRDPDRFVTMIPADQRRHLTEIPLAASGPWAQEERDALREALRRADEREPQQPR